MGGRDVCLLPMSKVVPAFMPALAKEKTGQNIEFGGQRYSVYGSGVEAGDGLFVAYFVNNTTLKRQAGEYLATRPAVMLIAVDTYDEILKEMKESDRARVAGEIDLALEQFIGATTGFLRRISASRYIAVVEERHMQEIVKNRFSILDKVREIGEEAGTVTLSIGVGRLAATLREGEAMAVQALDMALGRGGDQAAVKSAEGFEFYGGVSRSVEKPHHRLRHQGSDGTERKRADHGPPRVRFGRFGFRRRYAALCEAVRQTRRRGGQRAPEPCGKPH